MLAEALWSYREALCDYAPRLRQLRDTVNSPGSLSVPAWAHLYVITREFRPDLIIELGRGAGNSTALFTDCANILGNCKVVSLGYDSEETWKRVTAPRLQSIVGKQWYGPLQALHGDIMDFDFGPSIFPAQRILLFWDAHGYELGVYILAWILPRLEKKNNLVLVHDISDTRYSSQNRDYVRYDGLPMYYMGNLCGPFEELYLLFDFLSRNQIITQTTDHDVFHILRTNTDHWNELTSAFTDAFGPDTPLAHSAISYFDLTKRENTRLPVVYPPPDFASIRWADERAYMLSRHSAKSEKSSFLHVLYEEKQDRLMKSFETNSYGKSRSKELLYRQHGGILFVPSTPMDHLSTRYIQLVPRDHGGGNCLRVRLSFLGERRTGMNCIIYLQDRSLTQISGNLIFCDRKGRMMDKDRVEYVEISESVSAFRMVIMTKEGAPTFIPESITVEQSD